MCEALLPSASLRHCLGENEDVGEDIDLEREVEMAELDLGMFIFCAGKNCLSEDEEKTALKGLGLS